MTREAATDGLAVGALALPWAFTGLTVLRGGSRSAAAAGAGQNAGTTTSMQPQHAFPLLALTAAAAASAAMLLLLLWRRQRDHQQRWRQGNAAARHMAVPGLQEAAGRHQGSSTHSAGRPGGPPATPLQNGGDTGHLTNSSGGSDARCSSPSPQLRPQHVSGKVTAADAVNSAGASLSGGAAVSQAVVSCYGFKASIRQSHVIRTF